METATATGHLMGAQLGGVSVSRQQSVVAGDTCSGVGLLELYLELASGDLLGGVSHVVREQLAPAHHRHRQLAPLLAARRHRGHLLRHKPGGGQRPASHTAQVILSNLYLNFGA